MAKENLTSADQYNWADWHTSRIKGMFEALRCQGAITPEMTDELFRTFSQIWRFATNAAHDLGYTDKSDAATLLPRVE